jgi:hypothetical protein
MCLIKTFINAVIYPRLLCAALFFGIDLLYLIQSFCKVSFYLHFRNKELKLRKLN